MKTIEVDDELYQYIASNTKFIGESASDILRRLLTVNTNNQNAVVEHKETSSDLEKNASDVKAEEINVSAVKNVSNKKQNKQKNQEFEGKDISTDTNVVAANNDSPEKTFVQELTSKTSGQNIFDVINKEELATQRGAVGRFLLILANLYRVHADKFSSVLEIRGRDRLYFAKSELELLESSSSTKPKQIPTTQYWVITNSNTTKKKLMLTDVAKKLGYTADETEIIRDFL